MDTMENANRTLLPGGPLPPAPCTPDPDFEDRAYPTATLAVRQSLRANRGMIRALFATPEAKRIMATTVVVFADGTRTRIQDPYAEQKEPYRL